MNQFQQGDVIFRRICELPKDLKPISRKERGYVIAEGEHTGHAHVIEKDVELFEKKGVLYLKNKESVELKHEEHHSQTIEPGIWEIGIVREYDYIKDMVRNVQD